MFRRISNTWDMMSASWEVLKKDKSLLVFPLLSGFCCLLVIASFALPLLLTGTWQPPKEEAATAHQGLYYLTLFLFYLCNYFVIAFFNAAIIACAVRRMNGEEATVGDGLRDAASRIHLIAGWALLSATVGMILRLIEDRSAWVGRLVAGLLGMAWTVASYLAVPVLVIEGKGPIDALKDSTALLRKTWGEQVVGGCSFGLMFLGLMVPAIVLVVLGFVAGSPVVLSCCIGLAVIWLAVLGLVQSALQGIFQAAVYLYARDGQAPGFATDLLASAIRRK